MMCALLILSFLFPLAVFWMPAKIKGQGMRAFFLRRTLIVLPYLMWLGCLDLNKIQWKALASVALFSIVALLVIWERDEFLFKASQTYASLAGPLRKSIYFASLFNLLVFILGEEAFFRLGVLSILQISGAVVVQALAFVAGHYLTPWGKSFQIKDLLRQFVFALVVGMYFLETRDFFSCVLAHLILNLPEFIHLFRRAQMKSSKDEVFCGTF